MVMDGIFEYPLERAWNDLGIKNYIYIIDCIVDFGSVDSDFFLLLFYIVILNGKGTYALRS